jgi:hypothetical protein
MKNRKKKDQPVYGFSAPCARLTKCAALLIAMALSVPVFIGLTLLDILFF